MILYGQYDSPFVRRAAVALNHYGFGFERRVLSVFQDFEAMLAVNPLGKVPALQLDSGDLIFDSRAIIEYLDGIADPDRRLIPSSDSRPRSDRGAVSDRGPVSDRGNDALRREVLRIEAVGIGLAEKTYERGIEFSRRAPGKHGPDWIARLERQILSALAWIEDRSGVAWMVGNRMTRADLAVVMAATYLSEKIPDLYDQARAPKLEALRTRCEALPVFAASPYSAGEAAATGWMPEPGQGETKQ